MKKIIIIIALFCSFLAVNAQKTTGGNYTYIAQRYEWLAGVFKALGLPAGSGPAAFTTGQEPRAGAMYYDSLGTDAGFYIWTGVIWALQGSPAAAALPDELIQPGYVIYSGTGLKFYITASIARIDGIIYGTDYDSVTLSAADDDDPRKDVIYLASTGVEVLTGTPAGPAAEPQLEGGQIKLTVIDVPAASTTPGVTVNVIWDENIESVVTNTGTTTDPDNTANVYRLTKSVNVTSINNGDIVYFTLPSTINGLAYSGISFFLYLKSDLPTSSTIRVTFFNGAVAVSNEIPVGFNRLADGVYQGVSLGMSSFNFNNNFFDKVRIRYSGTATVYPGFYIDYVHLQSGIIQPGGGSSPVTVGPIDTKIPSPNGMVAENNVIYPQSASQTNPGLFSPADKTKLDSMRWKYFLENGAAPGNTLLLQTNDSTAKARRLIFVGADVDSTDEALTITIPGGSQDLQSVTDIGNQTNDVLISPNFAVYGPDILSQVAQLTYATDGTNNGGSLRLKDRLSSNFATVTTATLTDARFHQLPDKDGTFAMLSDITGGSGTDSSSFHELTQLDDSTWTLDRPDGTKDTLRITRPNIILDTLGAGVTPLVTWNNIFYARNISILGGTIDTLPDGGIQIVVDGGGNTNPDTDNTYDLGSSALAWKDAYAYTFKLKSALGGLTTLQSTNSASNFTITFPAVTGTAVLREGNETLSGDKTFSGTNNYGLIRTSSTSSTSNFFASSGSSATNMGSAASLQVEGSSGASLKALFNGGTGYLMVANNYATNGVFGNIAFTEPSSGNIPIVSSLIIKAPTITGAAGTLNNTATLYIDAAPAATVSDQVSAAWIASGNLRLGKAGTAIGTMSFEGNTSGRVLITPAAAAGTPTLTLGTTSGILAGTLTNTATLNFDLTAVNYHDLTITVTGAVDGDAVIVGAPGGSVPAEVTFFGWVSGSNTVTIRCSRVGGGGAQDPASGTFRASVMKY